MTPTPRPWKWLPKEGNFTVDASYNVVAEVPCQSGNPADGELIVTAVNQRDALLSEVAELRKTLGLLQGFDFRLDDSPHGQKIRRRSLAVLGKER